MRLKNYINYLSSIGKSCFTEDEAQKYTGLSRVALRSAVRRLKKKQEIASPLRCFFIIVPPEYYSLGSLPPEQFIDNLMSHLKLPYYVGLLSAAQYYGGAHQKPQTFQVIIPKARRTIQIGRVKVVFTTKAHAEQAPTKQFNTPRGYLRVATPETLILDLVSFPHQSGGISEVFNIFSELFDQLDIKYFAKAIQHVKKIPVLQRLGYIFDYLGLEDYALLCENQLKKNRYIRQTKLDPQGNAEGAVINERWNLMINVNLEQEHDT